ncbi:MAG: serine/threonine protein kinase, partial [Gemmatimonadaceae bacterium]|nr:serine/threonine protein kinase [Gemmatimonadaceae bacterium]
MPLREQLQSTLGDGYVVGRELGGGGMSRVFLAEEVRLGRTVVVKVLAPELAGAISAERFEREIRVAASLQQANIVPLLTAGDTAGLPYFTMPYVEGQSLRTRLASGGTLSIGECVSVMRDVARALGYAHEHGVVHRDIKPDNVLLSRGAAEVTDFGIAKALDAARLPQDSHTLTQVGSSIGTPAYMSPEQAAGDPELDHRADIYALGVLAYEMLASGPPFAGTPQAVMAAQVSAAPPPIARDDVPPALRRIVMKCLAKDPAHRYQSADELLGEIEAVATTSGTLQSTIRARRGRVLAWAGAAAGILALAWVGTGTMRHQRWVRGEAIPRIKQHAELAHYDSAWMLMRQVQEVAPK